MTSDSLNIMCSLTPEPLSEKVVKAAGNLGNWDSLEALFAKLVTSCSNYFGEKATNKLATPGALSF